MSKSNGDYGWSASGPDLDARGLPSEGAAISKAQNYAVRVRAEATYYVRSPEGEVRVYVDAHEDGSVKTDRVVA